MSNDKLSHEKSLYPTQENIFSPISKSNTFQNKNEYSPYVINQSNFQSDSNIKAHLFLTAKRLPKSNSKLYTPSPNTIKSAKLSDRYIPLKQGVNLIERFNLAQRYSDNNCNMDTENDNPNVNKEQQEMTYDDLLKQNILNGYNDNDIYPYTYSNSNKAFINKELRSSIFSFRSEKNNKKEPFGFSMLNKQRFNNNNELTNCNKRKINVKPYKTIEVDNLIDDFYLNLLDWSSRNDIAIGLGSSVLLWCMNKTKRVDLVTYNEDDKYVSGLIWSPDGNQLAIGTSNGFMDLYDVNEQKLIRTFEGHESRVGVISWSNQFIASGSKDCSIIVRDARSNSPNVIKYSVHSQEVCGLKWSFDGSQLASGGNDNKLMVYNFHSTKPIMNTNQHTAAVKAIAWSPHQNNLLVSGGGTADKNIRFWNTSTCSAISRIDTGSQVCNLVFSKTVNELVSTHGFSLNQIILWRIPSLTKIITLTGHSFRVLYLGLSPDGQNIVTGAGDQSLHFWNVFPPTMRDSNSNLFPSNDDLR